MNKTYKLPQLSSILVNSSNNLIEQNNELKTKLTDALLDGDYLESFYSHLFENDEADYTKFNDIEMIYLYIHQEKDQDLEKNTQQNTKGEYVRELLQTYLLFYNQPERFYIPRNRSGSLFSYLKERQIRLYQNWLKAAPLGKGNKPYSIATISRKTTIFKSFLHYLYNKGYISQPVHKYFISAKVGKKDRPNRDIRINEIIELLDYYKDNAIVHGLLSVLITTGARIEELCTAKVSDLTKEWDNSKGESHYWLEVTGKGNKKRSLLLHDNVYEAIVRYRKRRRLNTVIDPTNHSPLFTTPKGKAYKPNNLSMFVTKKMNEAEIPFIQVNNKLKKQAENGELDENDKDKVRSITPHTLRHGFAIISGENNSDVFRIMQTLGHENIETTMIYLENRQTKEQNVGHGWKENEVLKHI